MTEDLEMRVHDDKVWMEPPRQSIPPTCPRCKVHMEHVKRTAHHEIEYTEVPGWDWWDWYNCPQCMYQEGINRGGLRK